ncbi:SusD/RagB family nutrient-binding outer membrane lipoprotein [Rubrivirga sp.]|uniref:SusD/RagB family nutrient-binding outer membrane lipoprotein n=1 Tax=Rubrivirga sp. TaxID=1885344 RepID=UPI003B529747
MTRFTRAAVCAALAFGATGLAGCDFTDGNDVNPNGATTATADLLLNAAEVGQIQVQEGNFARTAGIFAGYFTGSDRQYAALEEGRQNSDDYSNDWGTAYAAALDDANLAVQAYDEGNNRIGSGVAKIHRELTFGTLADLFGDIPYSQALNSEEFEDPQFDAQADVYNGVIGTLNAAIADINSGVGVIGTDADLFFGTTNGSEYVPVANTLIARYHLALGNYGEAAAAARNGISDPSGDLVAPHGSSAGNLNQYWEFGVFDRGGYLTANGASAVQLLVDRDSASTDGRTDESGRLSYFYNAPSVAGADLNFGGSGAFGISQSFPIVTYVENQLILAEALLLTGDEDGALEALNEVREYNEDRYGDGDDNLEYETFESDDFADGNALLREILTEKYLSTIGQIVGFTDLRRTDNFIGIQGKDNGRVPQRFIYARVELNSNENAPSPIPGPLDELPVFASYSYNGV